MKKAIIICGEENSGTSTLGNFIKEHMEARLNDCYKSYADNLAPKGYYENADYLIVTGVKSRKQLREVRRRLKLKCLTIKVRRKKKLSFDWLKYNVVVDNDRAIANLKYEAKEICEKYLL
jgi:hypothetical protein